MIFSLFDRYEIFSTDWFWIEVRQNIVFSKIDINMTIIKKLWNWCHSDIDFTRTTTFWQVQSKSSQWWKFHSSRTAIKSFLKRWKKYRYDLWKTVSKHLDFFTTTVFTPLCNWHLEGSVVRYRSLKFKYPHTQEKIFLLVILFKKPNKGDLYQDVLC